jgi:hypothetical protein
MLLCHKVRVLKRQLHGRVRYQPADRCSLRSAEYSKVALALFSRHARDSAPLASGALASQVEALASPARLWASPAQR